MPRVGRGAEGVGELGVHQAPGEGGQQSEVGVVGAGRGGDEEDQVGGPVGGAEVDAGGAAAEGEGRLGDVGAAAVRDADAAVEAGRHLRLTGGDVGQESLQVGDPALGRHALGEGAGRRFLGVGGQVEVDQVRGDGVAHRGLLRTRIARVARTAGRAGVGTRRGRGSS
nr:hypothetical protein [Actinospica acidiphila]